MNRFARSALTSYSLPPQFRSTNELSRSTTSVLASVPLSKQRVHHEISQRARSSLVRRKHYHILFPLFVKRHVISSPGEEAHVALRVPARKVSKVAGIISSAEVTRKVETVEPKEQQTVVVQQKVEQAGEMLQAVPRVPVAGVRRRWGNRHTGSLQESSPEVSSSGVLSPSPSFQPSTPESAAVKNEELQLWDLDLHRGLQANGDHYRATITATTTTTVLPTTVTDPASPFTTPVEGLCPTHTFLICRVT